MENRGFVLKTYDSRTGDKVTLEFTSDHYAEQVLRGLVHSGFEVTIKEAIVTIPESLRKISEHQFQAEERTQLRARTEGIWGEGQIERPLAASSLTIGDRS